MADQSIATGFATSIISAVERGAITIPENYISKVIEWMELDNDEASELMLQARLKQQKPKGPAQAGKDLLQIINQIPPSEPPASEI